MNSLTGLPKYVRSMERSGVEVQLTSEAAWALYFSTTELPTDPTDQANVEADQDAFTQDVARIEDVVDDHFEFEICSSCEGDGHFDEGGSPTSDPSARNCVTCNGRGILLKPA